MIAGGCLVVAPVALLSIHGSNLKATEYLTSGAVLLNVNKMHLLPTDCGI